MNMYVHTQTQEKNLIYGFFNGQYPLTVFFNCSRYYYTAGLEGGGIQLKICICKYKRKEPQHDLCKFFKGSP